jgi:hypothetical protein
MAGNHRSLADVQKQVTDLKDILGTHIKAEATEQAAAHASTEQHHETLSKHVNSGIFDRPKRQVNVDSGNQSNQIIKEERPCCGLWGNKKKNEKKKESITETTHSQGINF